MAAFRNAHRGREDQDWQQRFERLTEEVGQLEPTDVMIERDGEVVLLADSRLGTLRLSFLFSVEDAERVSEISIDTFDERPNSLPPLALAGDGWPAYEKALGAYLRELAEADLFSGAVLIAEGDTVRFEGACGLASREFSVPNNLTPALASARSRRTSHAWRSPS